MCVVWEVKKEGSLITCWLVLVCSVGDSRKQGVKRQFGMQWAGAWWLDEEEGEDPSESHSGANWVGGLLPSI